jgi:hypothetical protein
LIFSITLGSPSESETAILPASIGEYSATSSDVTPFHTGRMIFPRFISSAKSPSSSARAHFFFAKNALLRMTIPKSHRFSPSSELDCHYEREFH